MRAGPRAITIPSKWLAITRAGEFAHKLARKREDMDQEESVVEGERRRRIQAMSSRRKQERCHSRRSNRGCSRRSSCGIKKGPEEYTSTKLRIIII